MGLLTPTMHAGIHRKAARSRVFYLPVVPGQINDSHVSQFKTAIETLPPGPVLGYCKLGMRAKTLYQRASTS